MRYSRVTTNTGGVYMGMNLKSEWFPQQKNKESSFQIEAPASRIGSLLVEDMVGNWAFDHMKHEEVSDAT